MGWRIKFAEALFLNIFFTFAFCPHVKATIVFSISNPVVDSDDQIEVDATVSGLISSSCSTSGCFLQAELQSAGGYFGYTYNNSGEFVDYFKNPGSTDEIKSKLFNFIPVAGIWSGKLKAKNNSSSQYYYGPGQYLLAFRRFSGNSLSPTSGDSNSLSVTLAASLPTLTPTDAPQDSSTPTPTSTPFVLKTAPPTLSPTSTSAPSPTPIRTPTFIPVKTLAPSPLSMGNNSGDSTTSADVLGVQDETATSEPVSASGLERPSTGFPFLAAGCILFGAGLIGFSVFSIIKGSKKSYTVESEKQDSQIS